MRAILAALATCGAISTAQTAAAGVVVVELFTSQGCSSCPPADKVLGELAAREDIIALSLHVDYWDYLGWTDAFAQPAFTQRQKQYAARAQSSMIYTPQMVIGGVDHIVGSRTMQLMDQLMRHQDLPNPVEITAKRDGNSVALQAALVGQVGGDMVVQIVRYTDAETVEIKRGENAGRTMTYHNVVTSWDEIETWTGAAPLEMTATLEGEAPGIVIIQEGGFGPILAAARID